MAQTLTADDLTAVATAVWNELLAGHTTADSAGLVLHDVSGSVTQGLPSYVTASSQTLTKPTSAASGSYASTYLADDTWLRTVNTATGTDVVLHFLAGAAKATRLTFSGHWVGGASPRVCDVQAWNWLTSAWDTLTDATSRMANSASDLTYTFALLSAHQKNLVAGDGEVRIRWYSAGTNTGDSLYLDQVLIEAVAAVSVPTAGDVAAAVYATPLRYAAYGGQVWVDSLSGVSGTVVGTNGLPTHPVASCADALTLCASMGVKRIGVAPASLLTLSADLKQYSVSGHGYRVDLNGKDVSYTSFTECEYVSGISTAADWECFLWDCQVGACTLGEADLHGCHVTDKVTCGAAAPYLFDNCVGVPIGSPGVDFGSAVGSTAVVMGGAKGVWTVWNMKTGDTLIVDGACDLTLDASCTGGTVYVAGSVRLTNNGSGQTLHDTSRYGEEQATASVTAGVTVGAYASGQSPATLVTGFAVAGDAMTLTAGERTSIAASVWAAATRTLSSFGTLATDVWAAATRSLTDKTGYALSAAYDHAKNLPSDPASESSVEAAIVANTPTLDLTPVLTAVADLHDFDPAVDEVAISAASRATLVDELYAAIISGDDEGAILAAILEAIAAADLSELDIGAIATAVWAATTRSLTDKVGYALTGDYDHAKNDVLTVASANGGKLDTLTVNLSADTAALQAALAAVASDVAAMGAGSGSIEWTYTLTDAEAAPIADAQVWVTTDAAGAHNVASGITDAFGVVTFWLDPGTYYVWANKSGWVFDNPDTETVAEP